MNDSEQSRCCLEAPRSTLDKLILFAMCSVILGLIISTVGYIYPRGSTKHNPDLNARQQEAVDIRNNNLANNLDICIVVGMGFIGLGGVVTSAVFCKSMVLRECEVGDREEDQYTLGDSLGGQGGRGYGTVGGEQR